MRTSMKLATAALVIAVAVIAVAVNALGNDEPAAQPDGGGSTGDGMAMCIESVPDCDDMVVVPGGDEPVSDDAGGGATIDPALDPQEVIPNPAAVDLRARPFDSATIGDDGRTVTVDFVSGIEPCYVLGRIGVDEGPNAVRITLFEGHLPTDEDVACIDLGVFKRTTITLDAPIGDRAIVDGSA